MVVISSSERWMLRASYRPRSASFQLSSSLVRMNSSICVASSLFEAEQLRGGRGVLELLGAICVGGFRIYSRRDQSNSSAPETEI